MSPLALVRTFAVWAVIGAATAAGVLGVLACTYHPPPVPADARTAPSASVAVAPAPAVAPASPAPPGPCAAAWEHSKALGCPLAPAADGTPWTEVCETAARHASPFRTGCYAAAMTCEAVAACGR